MTLPALDPEILDEVNGSVCLVVAPDYGVARLWMGRMGINEKRARIVCREHDAARLSHGKPGTVVFLLDFERIDHRVRHWVHDAVGPCEPRYIYRSIDEDFGVYRPDDDRHDAIRAEHSPE